MNADSGHFATLSAAFQFDKDDLVANRAGMISPQQRELFHLHYNRADWAWDKTGSLVGIGILTVLFLFLIVFFWREFPILIAIACSAPYVYVIVHIIRQNLFTNNPEREFRQCDQTPQVLRHASVSRSDLEPIAGDPDRRHLLHFGPHAARLTKRQADALQPDTVYTLYYWACPQGELYKILSVESDSPSPSHGEGARG